MNNLLLHEKYYFLFIYKSQTVLTELVKVGNVIFKQIRIQLPKIIALKNIHNV